MDTEKLQNAAKEVVEIIGKHGLTYGEAVILFESTLEGLTAQMIKSEIDKIVKSEMS